MTLFYFSPDLEGKHINEHHKQNAKDHKGNKIRNMLGSYVIMWGYQAHFQCEVQCLNDR